MQIYLPIADLPVNVFVVLGMGLAVGFISGMFGIGGGFLMTPLLIFIGISPAVVGRDGFEPHRGLVDVRRHLLLAAPRARSDTRSDAAGGRHHRHGRWRLAVHRCCGALGQLDITIGLSYVLLLGIGRRPDGDRERARDPARARRASRSSCGRPGSHTWIHGLPFKLRFKRSHIYVSAIPVWAIGFIIGFVGAVMGIGGGFLLVPMLIYRAARSDQRP